MLERIIFDLLNRGELSLSLIITISLLFYFQIKGINNAIKELKNINQNTSDGVADNKLQIRDIEKVITSMKEQIENITQRLEKLESRVERTEDIMFSFTFKSSNLPAIGNGHKKLYAKIVAAVSKSISDSYDYSFRSLFYLWLKSQIPKEKEELIKTFNQIMDGIKEIQERAVSHLPININGYNIQKAVLSIIRNALEATIEDYNELSSKIILFLEKFQNKSEEERADAIDLVINFLSDSTSDEINTYVTYWSQIFTEAIKEELSSGKQFIDLFMAKIENQDGIDILIENLKNVIAKYIVRMERIISMIEEGKDLKAIRKELNKKNSRRKAKRPTIKS